MYFCRRLTGLLFWLMSLIYGLSVITKWLYIMQTYTLNHQLIRCLWTIFNVLLLVKQTGVLPSGDLAQNSGVSSHVHLLSERLAVSVQVLPRQNTVLILGTFPNERSLVLQFKENKILSFWTVNINTSGLPTCMKKCVGAKDSKFRASILSVRKDRWFPFHIKSLAASTSYGTCQVV